MNAAELAGRLGLRKGVRDWRGTCPACGYSEAFAVRGRMDQPARVSCFSCDDSAAIGAILAAITAGAWRPPVRERALDLTSGAERERRARDVWGHALLASVSPVALYLA